MLKVRDDSEGDRRQHVRERMAGRVFPSKDEGK